MPNIINFYDSLKKLGLSIKLYNTTFYDEYGEGCIAFEDEHLTYKITAVTIAQKKEFDLPNFDYDSMLEANTYGIKEFNTFIVILAQLTKLTEGLLFNNSTNRFINTDKILQIATKVIH